MKKFALTLVLVFLTNSYVFAKGNDSFLSFIVLNMLVGMTTVNYDTRLSDNSSLLIKYFSGGYNISFFDKWEWYYYRA